MEGEARRALHRLRVAVDADLDAGEGDVQQVVRGLEDVRGVGLQRGLVFDLRHHRLALIDARKCPHLAVVEQFLRGVGQAHRLLLALRKRALQRHVLTLAIAQNAHILTLVDDVIQRLDVGGVTAPACLICVHAATGHVDLATGGIIHKSKISIILQ